jgi:hypothetical protein
MLRIDHPRARSRETEPGTDRGFLNSSQEIRFEGETQKQIYRWIEQVLGCQEYHQQSRPARGWLRRYVAKMMGRSRAQITRLIARYRKSGSLQPAPYRRHRFRSAILAPTWNCWPPSMRPTRT